MAADAQGGLFLAWGALTEDPGLKVAAASGSASGGFTVPVELSSPANASTAPSVASDGAGNAVVAWEEYRSFPLGGGDSQIIRLGIQVAERPAGGPIGPARRLSDPAADEGLIGVALDERGDGALAWVADGTIWLEAKPAGGGWGAPIAVTDHTVADSPYPNAKLAIDAVGDVLLAYSARGGDTRAWFKPAGAPLSAPQVVAPSWRFPVLAALGAGGEAALAWGDGTGVVATQAPPGGRFGSPSSLAAVSPSGLAVDGQGQAVLAIEASGGRGLGVVTLDPRTGFGPPQIVSGGGGEGSPAALAVDPAGDAILGWQHSSTRVGDPLAGTAVALRSAGQPFGSARELIPTPTLTFGVFGPVVTITDQGTASAAWTQPSGASTALLLQAYAGGAPAGAPVVVTAGPPAGLSIRVPPASFAPATLLSFARATVPDRRGRLTPTLTCGGVLTRSDENCLGSISLVLKGPAHIRLGLEHFRVPLDRATRVRIQLSPRARRLLAHRGRLDAGVRTTIRHPAGPSEVTSVTITH
ncbi:MAG: hypothetical protein QOF77_499 [Solirubrobacteraceae bacterium]|jgi:hypothetical protein|nr:hypothetical protein [Solirubrobacteraceae bacterium]